MKHALKFDISSLQGQRIVEAFPTLAAYPEFAQADNALLAYVIYAFDKGSELMKHKDSMKRREEALLLAGYKRNKFGAWNNPRCESILQNSDEEVKAMVYVWLRFIMQNRKFAYWVYGNEMIWQNMMKVGKPIEEGDDTMVISDGMSAADAKKAMAKGEEKEKDVQSAYNTRNNVFKVLLEQINSIEAVELEIFPDVETKEMVTDYVNQINAGSVERRVLASTNP